MDEGGPPFRQQHRKDHFGAHPAQHYGPHSDHIYAGHRHHDDGAGGPELFRAGDFLNAIIRVILTLVLVPIFGIKGEIVIIFVSAIMMLTLNSIQLIKFMNSLIKDL